MVDYNSLNDTHKKRCARRASAEYILLAHAVREYIRLTGIIELLPETFRDELPYKNHGDGAMPTPADLFYGMPLDKQEEISETIPDFAKAAKIYLNAKEEMLSLLPGYRHPVRNSIFAESMIFFACDLDGTMTGYTWTPLMMEVKESVSEPMRSKILQELKTLELTKGKLSTAIKERDDMLDMLDTAWKEYKPEYKNEPTFDRQKRVVREIGFSDGKRHKTFDPEVLYRDYVKLVRRKNYNRQDAVDKVATLHRISPGTALKELNKFRAQVRRNIKLKYSADVQKNMLPYLKGLVPNNR